MKLYLLGSCAQCSKADKSRLFVDYIKAMYEVVKELGKQPIIWADIILMHPEAVQELPKDLVFVDWNYGWEPDRFGKLDNLLKLGVKMWGATALRSAPDNVYLTQWMKHFDNLTTFLPFARSHGYEGIIETSWSTSGTYGFIMITVGKLSACNPSARFIQCPVSKFWLMPIAKQPTPRRHLTLKSLSCPTHTSVMGFLTRKHIYSLIIFTTPRVGS